MQRAYSTADNLIAHADRVLRTLAGHAKTTGRENPSDAVEGNDLNEDEAKLSAQLLRVNHAGEVAAQALYQGQSLTARNKAVQEKLTQAAEEENDHLIWCRKRLDQLGEKTSILDPAWYLGSLAIGATAGLAGDKWNLGFLAETEKQVVQHIESHLEKLPNTDYKTRAILNQMHEDESEHATSAIEQGGVELPTPIKQGMRLISKIMTKTSFWV
ncbi:2-polyprenyl-3-methyl-6-methoxy-1,4-benzoquinone monooxygenase [Cycloclasticus pugetii]|jgi:ubiquinone biosynthesis monooxygenase Coq7|uniref:2-polyprenyl-3-methyl-6-methoxy-1,4-benzoquinone monooxygenase n=1 Tax=Cycloclasticus pugetii TaxID=34068 RepID=UPI00091AF677|nr:2-polyprenyl-3-methyl-6-methoxy-1,4-benzoquinone monooxygenase [Cycloclasticus pugetii]SHI68932.1 ubiquinone biosynthesis monooxygenase Coq7 [Cycloclasticus pugetii]|tara:strand:+ start:714 stop:1355 length:642 start_codon:yes stop_codon:yes gene_type:complete